MNGKKQATKVEFYKFTGNNPTGISTFTLNIDKPCEVYFFCNREDGFVAGPNRTAIINNSFILNGYNTPSATRLYPYDLRLRCNLNEYDATVYTLNISQPLTVTVQCRYYEDAF